MGEIALLGVKLRLLREGLMFDRLSIIDQFDFGAEKYGVPHEEVIAFAKAVLCELIDDALSPIKRNVTKSEMKSAGDGDVAHPCTDSSYQPPCDECAPKAEATTEESQDPLLAPLIAGLKVILSVLEDPTSTQSAEERISDALGTAISEVLRKAISDVCKPRGLPRTSQPLTPQG